MKNKKIAIIFIMLIFLAYSFLPVSASSLAPDRTQQVLDLLAVECQNISDYILMAMNGDTSRYYSVKEHIAVTINNLTLLMNGYDNNSINNLWNMYNQFGPDANSAQAAAQTCSVVRGDIYRKISSDESLNRGNQPLSSFDDCVKAGYHVSGNTCFIGGNSVFDQQGNIIGFYYADCFDNMGFHMGSCWDCYYGADNSGCIPKP